MTKSAFDKISEGLIEVLGRIRSEATSRVTGFEAGGTAPCAVQRTSDHPVKVGDVLSLGWFDASQHIVIAVGKPRREWDEDLQYHRRTYPYEARVATREEIATADREAR